MKHLNTFIKHLDFIKNEWIYTIYLYLSTIHFITYPDLLSERAYATENKRVKQGFFKQSHYLNYNFSIPPNDHLPYILLRPVSFKIYNLKLLHETQIYILKFQDHITFSNL